MSESHKVSYRAQNYAALSASHATADNLCRVRSGLADFGDEAVFDLCFGFCAVGGLCVVKVGFDRARQT